MILYTAAHVEKKMIQACILPREENKIREKKSTYCAELFGE